LVVVTLLLLAYFVWPTPWQMVGRDLRRHRFTGREEFFVFDQWYPAPIRHDFP
jgi:hypothetical protein